MIDRRAEARAKIEGLRQFGKPKAIAAVCEGCGWHGRRLPAALDRPCPSCGAGPVVDREAYFEAERARHARANPRYYACGHAVAPEGAHYWLGDTIDHLDCPGCVAALGDTISNPPAVHEIRVTSTGQVIRYRLPRVRRRRGRR